MMPVKEMDLLNNSKDHDRHTCNCDGCKLYWTVGSRIARVGPDRYVLMQQMPFTEMTLDQFHREFMLLQRNLALIPPKPQVPHFVHYKKNAIVERQI